MTAAGRAGRNGYINDISSPRSFALWTVSFNEGRKGKLIAFEIQSLFFVG